MRLGWIQHQQAACVFGQASHEEQGLALALMGVALLMLAQDLALQDSPLIVVVD